VTHPYDAFEESRSAWYAMLHQEGYQRYFFLADLAWMGTLLWLASRLRGRHRVPACVGIVLISVLMASRMWVDPTPAPTDLAAQQVRLDSAPSGSVVTIPITPDRWEMLLTRH